MLGATLALGNLSHKAV